MSVLASNRRAYHYYKILKTLEAGISLNGPEVKSVRLGRVDLSQSFAKIKKGEVFLENCFIAPYTKAGVFSQLDPRRERKLLLHKKQINNLQAELKPGLTIVPLKLYTQRGLIKVLLGLAKGKRYYERKRQYKEDKETQKMIKKTMGSWG